MRVAIASVAPRELSQISMHAARAPFYLIYDERGSVVEVAPNPFVQVERDAAPQAATWLAQRAVTVLVAGDLGPAFKEELTKHNIRYLERSGKVFDVVKELNSG